MSSRNDTSTDGVYGRFKRWAGHAFAIGGGIESLSEKDIRLLERMAAYIKHRGMSEVAVMTLETCRPLNFLGSQVLQFFKPFVNFVFPDSEDFQRFAELLEDREVLNLFIEKIENSQTQEAERPKKK